MLFESVEMFILKILFVCSVTQFLFLPVSSQYRYDCDEHFCSKSVKCRDTECGGDARLIKNATKCGCCHVCVQQLEEGDACKTHELSVLPRQECGTGLKCEMNDQTGARCVPIVTNCTEDKRKARTGDVIECDEYGFYEPVVCKFGVLCYCVNKSGKRIFGTDLASNIDSMNCDCARDYDKFPRKVPDGNFLRCLPNGNYDPIQCSDESCYCIGDDTVGNVAKSIKELRCYDKERHRGDDEMLRSECWREKKFLQNQIQNYTENGIRVIGAYLPKCDLDGSYAPVQCKGDECYCVKENGDLYHKTKYRVQRSPSNIKKMTCRCLRDEMLMNLKEDEVKVKTYLQAKLCNDEGEYKEGVFKNRIIPI